MSVVLQIDQVWKEYRLGVIGHGYLFRDLQSWWARLRGREDPNRPLSAGLPESNLLSDGVLALRDLSLSVDQGEVIGIIGRNGAGKSTLLKLISRVTTPTRGEIRVKGRVSSLLEVGVGFHPELTGRENVFLNSAILRMTKEEIRRKFDEIVNFSGVEKFIDTPVKRYSSGMYMRLAFAVAAHLDSEIIIVDEVLAVGDVQFQQKCLAKIREISGQGRTVLFVSHNLEAITSVCKRAIMLDKGKLALDSEAQNVVAAYLDLISSLGQLKNGYVSLITHPGRSKKTLSRLVSLRSCVLKDENGRNVNHFFARKYASITLEFELQQALHEVIVEIIIENTKEQRIAYLSNDIVNRNFDNINLKGTVKCIIPHLSLNPGKYSLSLTCRTGNDLVDCIYQAATFDVLGDESLASSPHLDRELVGDVLLDCDWEAQSPSPHPLKGKPIVIH